ncbi:hypothetical protein NC651_031057 [Populus alba x Populus x berolinensis]|nr:hypothetical protein NC651_031057 [Populus alba x Populus x berolinensis]
MYEEAKSQVAIWTLFLAAEELLLLSVTEEKVMQLYRRKCEGPMRTGIRQGLISGTGFGVSFFLNVFCLRNHFLVRSSNCPAWENNFRGSFFEVFQLKGVEAADGACLAMNLFSLNETIRANIAYGKEGMQRKQKFLLHRSWPLHTSSLVVYNRPCKMQGYDTVVGERRKPNCQGGRNKDVAIARARVNVPKILLLDEATNSCEAGYESVVEIKVMDDSWVCRSCWATTAIFVLHRLALASGNQSSPLFLNIPINYFTLDFLSFLSVQISWIQSTLFNRVKRVMELVDYDDKSAALAMDALVIKGPKKSPLLLRLVVVAFAMVCGVYICSICIKQISPHTTAMFLKIRIFDQPCNSSNVEEWEKPYVHYPKPETFSREECACNPVRFFAIFSMQRSGSGWFETLLNSHINVSSNGEIFGKRERRASVSAITQTLDRVYNLDWFSSASKNECNAAVGFKWMP